MHQAFIQPWEWRGMQPKDSARQRVVGFVGWGWDNLKGSLYRNALFLMATTVIGNGLGLFFWVVVANRFRTSDLGASVALFSALGFVGGLGSLGIGTGLIRFLPESEDKTGLVNEGLTISAVVTTVLCIAFLFLIPVLVPSLSFALDPLYIVTIILSTMAFGIAPVLDSAVVAARRADLATFRTALFALLKIPIAVGAFVILSGRAGIFISLASSFIVSVVVAAVVFVPRVIPGYRPKPDFRLDRIRPIFRFSLGNYIAGVIGSAGTLLPTIFIYSLLGPNAGATNAAYFYLALVVAGLLFIIPGAVFTSFYAEASHRDMDRRRGERSAILFSLLLLIPAVVGLWIFGDQVLRLFSADVAAQSVTPMRILTFASIPAFMNSILGTRVRVRKRTLPLIISGAIFSGVTLGLGWILLQNPNFGINGLAYAYVLGQAAQTPYLYYVARGAYEEAVPTEPILGQPLE
jgi:O-antigen/teichoic acid export membrane protein